MGEITNVTNIQYMVRVTADFSNGDFYNRPVGI